MTRVLLLATTTGYQTRAFGDAASRLGVELVFATDRCHLIEDPWQDQAIPIRFYDEDSSVTAILESAAVRPIDGLIAVGDRPTVIAARAAKRLGLPWHPPDAAAAARHKLLSRERLRDAGLPVPWFLPVAMAIDDEPSAISHQSLTYPCVVKPVALSGSRGVMRADDVDGLAAAFARLRALMHQPEVRAERDEAHATALIEGFIPGREYALEGLMTAGRLQTLAIFDKPDPLDGPFFEETIYLTPSSAGDEVQRAIEEGVARAAGALGLQHGPIHAECRVSPTGPGQAPRVFVLEVAARPIGGLCARALRFGVRSRVSRSVGHSPTDRESRDLTPTSLEELLLRHALGEDSTTYVREESASGVMMIPIPGRGIFRRAGGVDEARSVPGVDDVQITAKPDQRLVPLPEGASYLGFIFARAASAGEVDCALRAAHDRLVFTIDSEWPVLAVGDVHYNQQHG
jgi:ATP-grasp domain-containing protein/L-aminoacid ligase-like protein